MPSRSAPCIIRRKPFISWFNARSDGLGGLRDLIRSKALINEACRRSSFSVASVFGIKFRLDSLFTLLSSNPSEFVIRVYDSFTQDLYKAAQASPGRSLRCSVDGAYGQVPNFKVFDKVVLVAGGSGASFTFAIALDLIEVSKKAVKSIDFIWIVRHQGMLKVDKDTMFIYSSTNPVSQRVLNGFPKSSSNFSLIQK
ncbi:hypothetical protein ACN38_g1652 [Penicillium nordicum]|uniref:Ferric reductase NAD binding domain-containing protein n=1 Tax=Penicillium nordicum TaxID=229535 RepID=A0A0M9WJK6_9EURO|nr:hypothetical protein ACN38_g1652 [Penicillium nordicum]